MKKNFNEFKDMIKGKKTAVVGIGVSNTPLIYFLNDLGAEVTAFDKKEEKDMGEEAEGMRKKGIKLVLGENYLEKLQKFDVIFKTPSMRIDSPYLIKAKEQGAYITSEMEEFVKYCPAKTIGVTGSDGKTTTTTIIYNILKQQGYKTWVGGNIGTPLFSKIEEITEKDKVVLELSSFQLMTMDVSTDVALITNLSPNHLDIHKDMEEYVLAKKNVFRYQDEKGIVVLNMDNELTAGIKSEVVTNLMEFSTRKILDKGAYLKDDVLYIKGQAVCNKDEIVINGMHNVENFLAAFCCTVDDVSIESMRKVATTFAGVEHRCEFVRELHGVRYFNDSIASSPTRTLAGLKAFEKPVILIAGGYDKKIPFDVLAEEGYKFIKVLVLIGVTKEKIKNEFEKVIKRENLNLPILILENMEEAVLAAKNVAKQGDIITLSPACASFDQFKNFEVRGNAFKDIVKQLH